MASPCYGRHFGQVIPQLMCQKSMSMNDSANRNSVPSRLDRALERLTGNAQGEGWLKSLAKTHLVDVIAFSSVKPSLIWSSRDGEEAQPLLDLAATGPVRISPALLAKFGISISSSSFEW